MKTLYAERLGSDFSSDLLRNTGLKNHRLRVEFMSKGHERMVCDISTHLKESKPHTFFSVDAFARSYGWYLFPYWNFTDKDVDMIPSPDSVLAFINDISFYKYDKMIIE